MRWGDKRLVETHQVCRLSAGTAAATVRHIAIVVSSSKKRVVAAQVDLCRLNVLSDNISGNMKWNVWNVRFEWRNQLSPSCAPKMQAACFPRNVGTCLRNSTPPHPWAWQFVLPCRVLGVTFQKSSNLYKWNLASWLRRFLSTKFVSVHFVVRCDELQES
jgi:hypothetical protein